MRLLGFSGRSLFFFFFFLKALLSPAKFTSFDQSRISVSIIMYHVDQSFIPMQVICPLCFVQLYVI